MTSEQHEQQVLLPRAIELGDLLSERGWRVTTAESCTGGWIAQSVTAVAGSSGWFEAGLVTYSNAMKVELLGVSAMTLEKHGAVSAETAGEMAAGALTRLPADLSVAVTGIAGPDGGTAHKPVGTVWFGFAGGGALVTEMRVFDGSREAVRAATVAHALARLIERLKGRF